MKLYLTKEIALTLEGGDFDPSSIEADIRDVKQDIVDNASLDALRLIKVQSLETHRSQTDADIAMLKAKPDNVFDATEVMADIEELKARPIAPDAVNIQPLEDKIQALENRVMPDIAPLEDAIAELESRVDNDTLYDDTELKTRLTIVENRADSDTIFDDTELKNRLSVVENRIDNDTIFDDTELKDRLTAVENKPDNDTVFDDSTLKLSHNSLVEHVRANTVQIYQDETEFLNADSSFGFIRDNYFNKRAMVERVSDRAYDAMGNTLIGMSVGINAKAKLQLTYKEDGKPDELKSFVPICRSNVIGTTLTPDDKDVFWAEWYSDSDNQSNYVIYRQDGTLVLAQWVGNKASSITELFDKLTAGGDVSSDIAVVHKLNVTDQYEYILNYNENDQYSLLQSGNYSYKVQNIEFTLDVSYTGMANNNLDFGVVGYLEPDPIDIMTDPAASDLVLKAVLSPVQWDTAFNFKAVGYYYLETPQGVYNRYDVRDTKSLDGNKSRLVAWADDNRKALFIPYFNGLTNNWSMMIIRGFKSVNPSEIIKSTSSLSSSSYAYSDIFTGTNMRAIFEITDDAPLTYMTALNSNKVPLAGGYSLATLVGGGLNDCTDAELIYEGLPEGISIASV